MERSHVLVSSRRVENGVGVRSWFWNQIVPVLINGTNWADLRLNQKPLWMHTLLEIWYHSTNRALSDPSSLLPVHYWAIQRAEDRSIYLSIYLSIKVDHNMWPINQYITTNQILYVLFMGLFCPCHSQSQSIIHAAIYGFLLQLN